MQERLVAAAIRSSQWEGLCHISFLYRMIEGGKRSMSFSTSEHTRIQAYRERRRWGCEHSIILIRVDSPQPTDACQSPFSVCSSHVIPLRELPTCDVELCYLILHNEIFGFPLPSPDLGRMRLRLLHTCKHAALTVLRLDLSRHARLRNMR